MVRAKWLILLSATCLYIELSSIFMFEMLNMVSTVSKHKLTFHENRIQGRVLPFLQSPSAHCSVQVLTLQSLATASANARHLGHPA